MDTLTHEAPPRAAPRRPRRAWRVVVLAVLAVAGLAVGTWLIVEANQADDLAVATEFADAGDIAWTTADGDVLAALFTEDGIWKEDDGRTYEGRDAISRRVSAVGYFSEMQHGGVTEVDEGVFAFPFECVWMGVTFTGEVQITVEGGSVSYAEVVKLEQSFE